MTETRSLREGSAGISRKVHMAGYQNYGPLLGKIRCRYFVPYSIKDLKRDHSFDNHPYV